MACTLFKLSPEEALLGVTRNAAKALGMHDTHGTIEVGKVADLCAWDVWGDDSKSLRMLSHQFGINPLYKCFYRGQERAL